MNAKQIFNQIRKPVPPPGHAHSSKRAYQRGQNYREIDSYLDDESDITNEEEVAPH